LQRDTKGTWENFLQKIPSGCPGKSPTKTFITRQKLLLIDAATELIDLRIPPGNRLEELKDDRKGQHSIRINDQWRICFVWKGGDAYEVEIVDYH